MLSSYGHQLRTMSFIDGDGSASRVLYALARGRAIGQPNHRQQAACRTRKFFEGLANSKTILLNNEDHDVFGDGTVVIKSTPGHTPGHQSCISSSPTPGTSCCRMNPPSEVIKPSRTEFGQSKDRTNQISLNGISNQNFTRDPERMLSRFGKLEVLLLRLVLLLCLMPPFLL
jgi:hypothetical protein